MGRELPRTPRFSLTLTLERTLTAQGFWTVDPFAPNPHYGSAADLKALSAALHARGMYLMVDIAVNHLASTDTDISDAALARKSDGKLLFQKESNFHPACGINWGNQESEQKW